jgi:transcriptional regulator with XRE-family HTH domain
MSRYLNYICNMEIKDRIRMVIDSHQLTAGAFADKIGVQRSNVSHVLSGRNKPSFEFVEKVLLAFPKVQAHWLLTGKQNSLEEMPVAEERPIMNDEPPLVYGKNGPAALAEGKRVVKIVTFYDDFTFDSYFPNEQ